MADKTTTLKTKTNDNVYPNVIGDNRKNAFVDSSTITHHFYDQTHKVGFQIANETNIKIQNSLQKPKGLTKTKLVGVGANGQENIEIGDNLTLANGKLSATGGGSNANYLISTDGQTYTGDFDLNKLNVLIDNSSDIRYIIILCTKEVGISYGENEVIILANNNIIKQEIYSPTVVHFITMIKSSDNVALYLTIINTDGTSFTADTLASYLVDHKVLVNGNLHGVVPTYISGEGGIIKIYYRTPGDSNINPTPDEYQDLTSFTISDIVD